MEQIKKFFTSFIGQTVWQVRRGHGSFLTMEFGAPHLSVREPIVPNPDTCGRVRRNLQRRHVDITGDWHFWVQYGEWRLSTDDGALTSDDFPGTPFDECLRDLEDSGSLPSSPAPANGLVRSALIWAGAWKSGRLSKSRTISGVSTVWTVILSPATTMGLWFLRRLTWSNEFISLST